MSEASHPPARDAGPDAPAQASSIATTRPPIPRLPVGRLAFLLLAGVALLAGLDASLVRLGALAPVASTSLGTVHGLLMIIRRRSRGWRRRCGLPRRRAHGRVRPRPAPLR